MLARGVKSISTRASPTFHSLHRAMATRAVRVAAVSDIPADTNLKNVDVPGSDIPVLLARLSDGSISATTGKCTHYGAPLDKGVLNARDEVICPWHGARFNLKAGGAVSDIEDLAVCTSCAERAGAMVAPALNPLAGYPVEVRGEDVYITLPESGVAAAGKLPLAAAGAGGGAAASSDAPYVIVGGGAAGLSAAQSLREQGYTGGLRILSADPELPCDRPLISKATAKAATGGIVLRDQTWFDQAGIDITLGEAGHVDSVDVAGHKLTTKSGEVVPWSKLLVATGAAARRLPVGGVNAAGVHVLRSMQDARDLMSTLEGGENAKAKRTVIVGTSFIGMECAATLLNMGYTDITLLGADLPFSRVFGDEVGALVKNAAEAAGLKFQPHNVTEFHEEAGKVKAVKTSGGDVPAEVVVLGVGAALQVPAGIPTTERGAVPTDATLAVRGASDVFAAGDIAQFQFHGQDARIEHWTVALQQGRVAAANMLGQAMPYTTTPFFWTGLPFLGNIRYVGYVGSGFDRIAWDGGAAPTPEARKFIAYYIKGDTVAAVATLAADPVCSAVAACMEKGNMPSAAQVTDGSVKASDFIRLARE